MRIVFIIHRKNYYRLLGPAIEEGLRRGWRVECWHDWSHARRGGKASEFPDVVPPLRHGTPEVQRFQGLDDLAARLRADSPDVIVAIDPPRPDVKAATTARWLWLQYSADILFYQTPEPFLVADALATYSAYWAERLEERHRDTGQGAAVKSRSHPVGMPELDVIPRIDPAEVRRRFGLPGDRPIVLYLPFPLRSNPQTFWLRGVFTPSTRLGQAARTLLARRMEYWEDVRRGRNDRRLVEAVRDFCDREGAALVMKSRLKDPIPRYALRRAERALYDPSHYPPTILELLSVASLCIHAYSGGVFEAAACRVPSLCLAPEAKDMGFPDLAERLALVHNLEPEGIYNWPGAAYCAPLREAFDSFATWRLEDFPLKAEARRGYVERFLGFDDGRSSERLLDLAETLVKEPTA
jgi:hypothetical protein